jgi:hypothetical protein
VPDFVTGFEEKGMERPVQKAESSFIAARWRWRYLWGSAINLVGAAVLFEKLIRAFPTA